MVVTYFVLCEVRTEVGCILDASQYPKGSKSYLSIKQEIYLSQEVKIALHSLLYHHTYRCDDTRGCVMQL